MKQGQETNQIWTQEAGTHDTHDGGLTLLPPPERLSSIGEGGWALWRPLRTNTDKNTGRGPPEWNRQTGTMAELGALEAMADGLQGLGLGPLGPARPLQPELLPPPPKNFPGEVRGIRSPPGLNRQDKQDREALQGQTNRTGQPTGTRSPPGLAWKLRLHLGMTSGALTGSLSNRFHLHDKGAGG